MAAGLSSYGKAKTWTSTDTAHFGNVYAVIPTLQGSKYYLETVIAFSLTRASGLCHEWSRRCRSQFIDYLSIVKDCFAAVTASSAASFFTRIQG